ncbi:MAG: hypothetical protein CVU56_00740 [Deltaproteobacteria bacterium HGW-Deltaproteobacteria-14]|jgi:hypothetical protein|nr:MAG: hypothetical protein CVU56_00740 [Deltaproteobacteria bacterium HGW-Deltaproteobacteria-14]
MTAAPRVVVVTCVAALLAAMAPAARADDGKRAIPDYDNRAEEGTTAGEVLLWIPRVLMSPFYLVSEYVLRRPVVFLAREAERTGFFGDVGDVFTFGGSTGGIIPTFAFDFGLDAGALPSAGLYFFWDHLFFDANDLRLRVAYGGSDWITLDLADRINFDRDAGSRLKLLFSYERRKDWVFAGIGGRGGTDAISRYGEDRIEGGLGYDVNIGPRGYLEAGLVARRSGFFDGGCCGEPRLDTLVAGGTYAVPPGFERGFTAIVPSLSLAIDSRPLRPSPESGVRLELTASAGLLTSGEGDGWLQYGAAFGGSLDIWHQRTIGLWLDTSFVRPIGDGQVPFTELVELGGKRPMRAFSTGLLRGSSTFSLTFRYSWPIWVWLDGALFASVGNAFGQDLAGFSFERMRASFGFGIMPGSRDDHPFEFLLALGTSPFDLGGDITTFRVVVGTTTGF